MKHKINISESVIREALHSAINNLIDEERIEHPNGYVEVDNFDLLKDLMTYDNPGDTLYFIQIKKRDKDNEGQKSKFQAAMHLKEYYIFDEGQLDSARAEIIDICQRENARAYIWLNARSKKVVDEYTKKNYERWIRDKRLWYRYGGKTMALAAAKSLDIDERPRCFVDVDSPDQKIINQVMKIIQDAGITPERAYRSPNNGIHIILPDKEAAKKLDFSPINGDLTGVGRVGQMNAVVGVEIDKPCILYSYTTPKGYGKQQATFANQVAKAQNPRPQGQYNKRRRKK